MLYDFAGDVPISEWTNIQSESSEVHNNDSGVVNITDIFSKKKATNNETTVIVTKKNKATNNENSKNSNKKQKSNDDSFSKNSNNSEKSINQGACVLVAIGNRYEKQYSPNRQAKKNPACARF